MKVVRGIELNVGDEPSAEKADEVAKKIDSALAQQYGPDYAGHNRLVCKSEWDYKVFFRFKTLDALKNVMETSPPALLNGIKEMEGIAKGGKVHVQNFVFDEANQ